MDAFRVLGRVVATAVRSQLLSPLRLTPATWRAILAAAIREAGVSTSAWPCVAADTGNGSMAEPCVGGLPLSVAMCSHLPWPAAVQGDASSPAVAAALASYSRHAAVSHFAAGLRDALPVSAWRWWSAHDLEVAVCGARHFDVELLRRCTVYGKDMSPHAVQVQWLWQVLREMLYEDQCLFLLFVWGRGQLPHAAVEFPMPFKIDVRWRACCV